MGGAGVEGAPVRSLDRELDGGLCLEEDDVAWWMEEFLRTTGSKSQKMVRSFSA